MGENEKQGKSQKKRLVVILIMLIVFIVLAIVFVSCRSMSKDRKKDSENSSEESILEDDASIDESLEAVNSYEGNVPCSEKESDEPDVFSGNNESESDESHTDASTSQVADDEVDEPEDTQSSDSNDSEISASTTESVNTSDEETTQHQHNWVAQYTTVHYEEEGHYEEVLTQEAYEEAVYETHNVCNYCGFDMTANNVKIDTHCLLCGPPMSPDDPFYVEGATEGSTYGTVDVQVDTIHHDAVYETKWIVDKAAYDEKVLTGYTCTCGATKSN